MGYSTMKHVRTRAAAAALFLLALLSPAVAQWQTPNHSVPVGRGAGVMGFGSAAPGAAGLPLVSNGATLDPSFQLLPLAGVTGFGANVATFLATPTSANLAAALTNETGTGFVVFSNSPALTGIPTAPTPAYSTNTNQIATTAFVQQALVVCPVLGAFQVGVGVTAQCSNIAGSYAYVNGSLTVGPSTGLSLLAYSSGAVSSLWFTAPTPRVMRAIDGSTGSPITAPNSPTMFVERREAITSGGGDGSAAATITATNNISGAQQGVAITGMALGAGSANDIVGVYGSAWNFGNGIAYGIFSVARTSAATAGAVAIQTATFNDKATNVPYQPTVAGLFASKPLLGLDLDNDSVGGNYLSSAAIDVRASSGQWDVGLAFMQGNFVKTALIQDNDTSAISILRSQGTHTNGLDLSGGTFSGTPFKSTGFSVDATGLINTAPGITLANSTASITWTTSAANVGIDFGSGTAIKRQSSDGHPRYLAQSGLHEFVNANLTSAASVSIGQSTGGAGSLILYGATSGGPTIVAQAVAGTPTLTLPSVSGTFAISATSPLVLSATTGALTCPTCATTAGGGTIATLTFGTHLTSGGSSYNGSAGVTITSDATNLNTASTIVARDGSGNFSAGTITAALSGNASTASAVAVGGITGLGTGVATWLATPTSANLAAAITDETGSGALVFGTTPTIATPVINGVPTGTGVASANTVSTLVARDGSGNFSAGTITAALTGNATTATTATNATNTAITDDTTTNATMNVTWVTSNTGNLPQKVTSTKLTFNPSTGVLSSTSFTGAGTGLTGTAASLTTGNVTTNANLTGVITSVGNATSIASQTGTGTTFVMSASPTITGSLTIPTITGTAGGNFTLQHANGQQLVFGGVGSATAFVFNAGANIFYVNPDNTMALGTSSFRWSNVWSTNYSLAGMFASTTAPTATTFCTSPSIPSSNGTAAFTINVGTACATSTGTITLPAATNGWKCDFADVTTPASNIPRQTGGTTTTVTLTNYAATTGVASNWTASEIIRASCTAY